MSKQKILIVDDMPKNLDEARTASKNFSKYQFVFLNSAFEALSEIVNAKEGDIRGVVTDLFFPREKEMDESYDDYISIYDSCDHSKNPYKLRVPHNRLVLTESPFLAYGGVIALQCFTWGIPVTLVTTMHRHVSNVDDWIRSRRTKGAVGRDDPASNADATLILAPLIDEGVMNLEDVMNNRHPERYIGTSGGDKPWGEAMRMCLSQKTSYCRNIAKETPEKELERLCSKLWKNGSLTSREWARKDQLGKEVEKKVAEERVVWLKEKAQGFEMTDELLKQLLPYANDIRNKIKVCSPEIALVTITYWGDNAPNSKACCWSIVRCFCRGQSELKRYLVLNRTSDSCSDTFRANSLRIEGFGEIKISTDSDGEKVTIDAELVNEQYGNRWVTFAFDKRE